MRAAAVRQILQLVTSKPDAAIMLAAGSTPLGTYAGLVEKILSGELQLTAVQFFQLDAYLGESELGEAPSCSRWLREVLLDPAGLSAEQLVRLCVDNADPAAAAVEFEGAIASAGGLDLAVLGLGANGHVGFNEPLAHPESRTRLVDLLPETIAANQAYWGGGKRVPRQGMTAGIATIMGARQLMMQVSGAGKAEALRRTLEGDVSDEVPASRLRAHPALTVIADVAAAGSLCSHI